jgi:Tfp pilus assembly protein PilO
MDKKTVTLKQIVEQLKSKKAKDYTYLTFFFLIFSIFIIFAIRPSLVTAFSLRQQRADLAKLDFQYENVVSNIVVNQSTLENLRDKLYLTDDAFPPGALINKLVSDIESAGAANSITYINENIGEVDLVQKTGNKSQAVLINVEATCTFDDLLNFIQGISSQRRLKLIKQLSIAKDTEEASESSQLKVLMQIEGYYL